MNNGRSSALVEGLCDVNAGMAADDDGVKCSVLSAQQNGKAGKEGKIFVCIWGHKYLKEVKCN